jgi:hypothetical protein
VVCERRGRRWWSFRTLCPPSLHPAVEFLSAPSGSSISISRRKEEEEEEEEGRPEIPSSGIVEFVFLVLLRSTLKHHV